MHKIAIRNGSSVRLKLDGVRNGLRRALERHGVAPGEVSVLVTSDEEMRRINREFRKVDASTDVLSFPAPASATGHVGDVAISIDFARRQAKMRNVPIEDEVAMLAIHAGLHLAGFDDRSAAQRKRTVAAMNEIAVECGIAADAAWSSLPPREET